ncbi:MAG: potassium channel family protein [Candidatus Acidiferrales bacterium]
MRILAAIVGCFLLVTVIVDSFQTVILARRANRKWRITRAFYLSTWTIFSAIARRIKLDRRRETYLGVFGALSLVSLFALWACGLILAFALMQWAAHGQLLDASTSFGNALYFSAATFFTLGSPVSGSFWVKLLTVSEVGLGYSFLALVISYLPVFYGSFSQRELRISLLDARAGSPPVTSELLLRQGVNPDKFERQLADWEEWGAELLESHLSYPVLAYFRSQHSNQSWLATLTTIVDASAVVMITAKGDLRQQAEVTFAIGQHALKDLTAVFRKTPRAPHSDRLPEEDFARLRTALAAGPVPLQFDDTSEDKLRNLRAAYEPYAYTLSLHFMMLLPSWVPGGVVHHNWQIDSPARPALFRA